MSKINQIEAALREVEGGKFQRVANSYVHEKGYRNLNTIGSVIASDKTRVGTPDAYSRQPNGKLVFIEHTTDQGDIEGKLNGDLNKCLNEEKHGVPLDEIEEIILCHTSNL